MPLPTFLGIGFGRSGTRWLAQCLSEHPEIYMHPSETYFFSGRHMIHRLAPDLEDYESLFDTKRKYQAWGEITPAYIYDTTAPHSIKDLVPDAKLICTMREQSDWWISIYRSYLRAYPELYFSNYSFDIHLRSGHLPQLGFYLEYIQRFLALFHRKQILFLLFDDLRENPRKYVASVFKFLGVDSSFEPPTLHSSINTTENIQITRSHWLKSKLALVRPSSKRRYMTSIWRRLERANTKTINRKTFPPQHKMSPVLLEYAFQLYEEHNRELGQFLDKDLSDWNRMGRKTRKEQRRW